MQRFYSGLCDCCLMENISILREIHFCSESNHFQNWFKYSIVFHSKHFILLHISFKSSKYKNRGIKHIKKYLILTIINSNNIYGHIEIFVTSLI